MWKEESMFDNLCNINTLYDAWKQVKAKNATGGVDGVTIAHFEEHLHPYLVELADDLKTEKWVPEPYSSLHIPKKKNEMRKIGLLSIKDKIVQTAIKNLVEPLFENQFVDNSYGYRPGKGHTKAIRRTFAECQKKTMHWVLRLDIDNYFDSINHRLLQAWLPKVVADGEIVRLMMLCMQMGVVDQRLKWSDVTEGVPQGAILSPLLSNFYLHSFDQYVLTMTRSYVRYADDFCIICQTHKEAQTLLNKISTYLRQKLNLGLNTPEIKELHKGFEFLGISISKTGLGISQGKQADFIERINALTVTSTGFPPKSLRAWNGVKQYYSVLLPQESLRVLDDMLYEHLKKQSASASDIMKTSAAFKRAVSEINYLSNEYLLHKNTVVQDYTNIFNLHKGTDRDEAARKLNKQIIQRKKSEYRKREAEGSELVVSAIGSFIGLSGKGITVKQKGKILYSRPIGSLSHITISGKGISLSTNLIDYCLANKITIDFFNSNGKHTGSVLSTKYIESTLWNKQAQCSKEKRMRLAFLIIDAKLKNQYHLVKYFNKYHKNVYVSLKEKYDDFGAYFERFREFASKHNSIDDNFIVSLVGHEAQGAIKYWAYIRELLSDDNVSFEGRSHKGATDLVNCMLNYGYAILYARVWKSLLGAKLNPFDSIVHIRQAGKPTFVYDVVEMFRAQVVDRVVISLIQKGKPLAVEKGMLCNATKKILSDGILMRLNRYEHYRGEELTMEQIISRQAREIAQWIDNGTKYKPYIAKW